MGSTRIRGTTLSMRVDGTDYWADVTSCVMDGDTEGGGTTLCGAPQLSYRRSSWFEVEAVQSTDEGSFWSFLWDHEGQSVPFAYAPHGNSTPSSSQPHFTGILVVPPPPALGGAAGASVEQVFTTRLPIAQGPYRVTTE